VPTKIRRCYSCRTRGRDGSDCPICQESDSEKRLELARLRMLDAGHEMGATIRNAQSRTVDGSIFGAVRAR